MERTLAAGSRGAVLNREQFYLLFLLPRRMYTTRCIVPLVLLRADLAGNIDFNRGVYGIQSAVGFLRKGRERASCARLALSEYQRATNEIPLRAHCGESSSRVFEKKREKKKRKQQTTRAQRRSIHGVGDSIEFPMSFPFPYSRAEKSTPLCCTVATNVQRVQFTSRDSFFFFLAVGKLSVCFSRVDFHSSRNSV